MSLFEYLAIAFSLVLSSSAMRLIRAASHALDWNRRYWVHAVFLFNQLGVTLGVFWAFWSLRDVVWTFPAFVLALSSPALVYAASCALTPDDPSTVNSWRDYYFSSRIPFFSYVACWAIVTALGASVLLEMSWWHPARFVQAFAFVSSAVGILSRREGVHAFLAVLFLAVVAIGMATVLSQPSSLAP